MSQEYLDELREVFIVEAREHLDAVEQVIVHVAQGQAGPDAIDTVFRGVHTVKGGAGAVGYTHLGEFTHVLESVLSKAREGELELVGEVASCVLSGLDVLADFITRLEAGDESEPPEAKDVCDRLAAISSGASAPAAVPVDAANAPTVESVEAPKHDGAECHTLEATIVPDVDIFAACNDPMPMFQELDQLGELTVKAFVDKLPALKDLDSQELHLHWKLTLEKIKDAEEAQGILDWIESDAEIEAKMTAIAVEEPTIDLGDAPEPEQPESATTPTEAVETSDAPAAKKKTPQTATRETRAGGGATIRVETKKIDDVLNLVGELVIAQSMLMEQVRRYGTDAAKALNGGLSLVDRQTRALQESVLLMRMVPIRAVFDRIPRVVFDLEQKLGKEVDLQVSGEWTEVDREVIQSIGDPLLHMVRNAVDHGIEMPDDRESAGKKRRGVMQLSADHEAGDVVIRLSDDGGGIARDRVRAKAISSGILSADTHLSDSEIDDLIFHPGLSTQEQLSDVSGRGVGMDVVRRGIQALGGTVKVTSTPGQGTQFTIRLPLTLAIMDGQLIEVAGHMFVVPLRSVVEWLEPQHTLLRHVPGIGRVYPVRGEQVPVMDLHGFLGMPPSDEPGKQLLLAIESGGHRAALPVDRLHGQQQVVLKSLSANYGEVEGVAGATILGDGKIAMVLEPRAIVAAARHNGSGPAPMSMDIDVPDDTPPTMPTEIVL